MQGYRLFLNKQKAKPVNGKKIIHISIFITNLTFAGLIKIK